MKNDFRQSVVNIAEICARKHVHHAIISPGSRSAPITLAFLRHPNITCRTVVDERSAGFIALGLAQQTEQPVALICTSGTAALNYGPAVAEAYYQQIPLVVFTADRPPEWIDQNDGQTLNQIGIYGNFCRASFVLPTDDSHPDAKWHSERIISDAINLAQWPIPGPVQVNVPLREPLYPKTALHFETSLKTIEMSPAQPTLDRTIWNELLSVWQTSTRKLIVAGLHKPNPGLSEALQEIREDPTTVLLSDVTANLHEVAAIGHFDTILGVEDESIRQQLAPELLLTFGGPVVSKSLKLFLRERKPKQHWRLQLSGPAIDTFQSLTRILPVAAEYFFKELLRLTKSAARTEAATYARNWARLERRANDGIAALMQQLPHCELSAMQTILNRLPDNSRLQLGNSFVVRLASFLGLPKGRRIKVNSNRGTSGIDGTLGTAVGAALATDKLTTLIIGDLAFFYDRNALWHESLPANLRIVIINNQGGGIFRIIDGPNTLPELARHFEVEHQLTARRTAEDHGLAYAFCNSTEDLDDALRDIFGPKSRPAILEVHTDKKLNVETFERFKSLRKEIK